MTKPLLSLWINGKAQASASSRAADIFNPATGEVIRRVPLANKQDVEGVYFCTRSKVVTSRWPESEDKGSSSSLSMPILG